MRPIILSDSRPKATREVRLFAVPGRGLQIAEQGRVVEDVGSGGAGRSAACLCQGSAPALGAISSAVSEVQKLVLTRGSGLLRRL